MNPFPNRWFFPLFVGVVLVQGVHVFEHVIQLFQVHVLGMLDDDALGLLGYVFEFQGTEEWLHLVFNASYLIALFLLLIPLWYLMPSSVPPWAFWVFAIWGVGLESWHMVEHGVIITNVIRNSGCPCPGIGDVALGTTDTILHFFYNAIDYLAVVVAFWFVAEQRSAPRPAVA